jgi:hypothetical protein
LVVEAAEATAGRITQVEAPVSDGKIILQYLLVLVIPYKLETVAATMAMAALAIFKVLRQYQAGAAALHQILAALTLIVPQVVDIPAMAVEQEVSPTVGVLAGVLAVILGAEAITASTHMLVAVAQVDKITHQHMGLVQAAESDFTAKAQVVQDSILRGTAVAHRGAAETVVPAALKGTGDKIHGVVVVKVLITFKVVPTVAAAAAPALAGQHHQVTDIPALFEYYGELQ